MPDATVVQYCAPTLAGIKTGSLFSYACPPGASAAVEVKQLDAKLSAKGLRAIGLGFKRKRLLVYVFRPDDLKRDLSSPEIHQLMESLGYQPEHPGQCLKRLIHRLSDDDSFPHEIGVFLGYPPEDVIGFIENHAANALYTGAWKVYGNVEQAKRTFEKYRICTDVMNDRIRRGNSLEQLTAAVRK
ncbi:MAG: DUF3793 family protein [Solobacterium sp.]|nr:DUF3793 family protein [Solobacterium sp.]